MDARISLTICIVCMSSITMAQHPVEGTWEWQYTLLESGERIDPSTEGYTRQLYFGEWEERSFIEYRNEAILLTGYWGLSYVIIGDACYELLGAWSDAGEFVLEGFPAYPDLETMVLSGIIEEHFTRREPVSNELISWGKVKAAYW